MRCRLSHVKSLGYAFCAGYCFFRRTSVLVVSRVYSQDAPSSEFRALSAVRLGFTGFHRACRVDKNRKNPNRKQTIADTETRFTHYDGYRPTDDVWTGPADTGKPGGCVLFLIGSSDIKRPRPARRTQWPAGRLPARWTPTGAFGRCSSCWPSRNRPSSHSKYRVNIIDFYAYGY